MHSDIRRTIATLNLEKNIVAFIVERNLLHKGTQIESTVVIIAILLKDLKNDIQWHWRMYDEILANII